MKIESILRDTQRSVKKIFRKIHRSFRDSPAHDLLMKLKHLRPRKIQLAPPLEAGSDGKILISMDQLCLIIGMHLRDQPLVQGPEWQFGRVYNPIIEDDPAKLEAGAERFVGIQVAPYTW